MVTDTGEEHHSNTSHLMPPWKKGQSGNPGGRPKGKSITAELRKLLDEGTTAEELAKVLLTIAKDEGRKSQLSALIELIDRTDGKVTEKHLFAGLISTVTPETLEAAQKRLSGALNDTQRLIEDHKDAT